MERAVARYSLLDRCAVWKGSFIILSGHKTKFRQYLPIRLQGLLQRTDGIPENVPLSSLFFYSDFVNSSVSFKI